jgi:hypothetical protein
MAADPNNAWSGNTSCQLIGKARHTYTMSGGGDWQGVGGMPRQFSQLPFTVPLVCIWPSAVLAAAAGVALMGRTLTAESVCIFL